MLLLSCFRTAITHLAVKLRIRHVGTWRAQCLTCLYVVLINSFFFLTHSLSLSFGRLFLSLRQSFCLSPGVTCVRLPRHLQPLRCSDMAKHIYYLFSHFEHASVASDCNWMNFSARLIRDKLRNAITQALFALFFALCHSLPPLAH